MELMERKDAVNDCYNSCARLEEPASPGHAAWLMRLFLSILNSWCFISRGDQFIACLGTVGRKRYQLLSKLFHMELNHQDFTFTFSAQYNWFSWWLIKTYFFCVYISGSVKWTRGAFGSEVFSQRSKSITFKGICAYVCRSHECSRSEASACVLAFSLSVYHFHISCTQSDATSLSRIFKSVIHRETIVQLSSSSSLRSDWKLSVILILAFPWDDSFSFIQMHTQNDMKPLLLLHFRTTAYKTSDFPITGEQGVCLCNDHLCCRF